MDVRNSCCFSLLSDTARPQEGGRQPAEDREPPLRHYREGRGRGSQIGLRSATLGEKLRVVTAVIRREVEEEIMLTNQVGSLPQSQNKSGKLVKIPKGRLQDDS